MALAGPDPVRIRRLVLKQPGAAKVMGCRLILASRRCWFKGETLPLDPKNLGASRLELSAGAKYAFSFRHNLLAFPPARTDFAQKPGLRRTSSEHYATGLTYPETAPIDNVLLKAEPVYECLAIE